MGLFSFTQEIAMDLGTANTIITSNGKIVVVRLWWTNLRLWPSTAVRTR